MYEGPLGKEGKIFPGGGPVTKNSKKFFFFLIGNFDQGLQSTYHRIPILSLPLCIAF